MNPRPGYAMLIIVLIVAAVALAVGLNLKLRSIAKLDAARIEYATRANFAAAQGCLEEALRNLKQDPATYRSDTLSINETVCTIRIGGNGPTHTIDITAQRGELMKRFRAIATLGAIN